MPSSLMGRQAQRKRAHSRPLAQNTYMVVTDAHAIGYVPYKVTATTGPTLGTKNARRKELGDKQGSIVTACTLCVRT